ncbi:magnesium-translocating P-type ATPase [Burkholderia pseudomultivorans]|uniref:Magnesium-transporting ATPase, P-type 1 n=2 Tax=Burkholderia pseudomultivorans TaxID=1207504 RepID=A0ABU2DX27_9BURK|nr:magnesium-translocating P-type ATPase [Burkholderia pseudomultivorans]MDR8733665.1 Magnesium-transporting ATPase, P-type 1 [Burkholderia pseudomultivorans]MDR8740191.1 Magnesium-transporting ATPase, P-type 1 [Burkholderia pseudomultivorans]MDR8752140.1 Magnesium-transporting ATPase, P-type 1 [Burkholderia pseudomultivorans]MDR8776534.1 Magnesium-transporting ATPase, P-type 1 [Burkholderia pseudomultivorans]MDR8819474.1 Magnesium-transporting ATPase, P-type 1 [Burkholderia pseudomultivorans]
MTQRNTSHKKQRGFIKTGAGQQHEPRLMRAAQEAARPLDDTLKSLHTSTRGLTCEQAADRLLRDGPNEIAHDKPPHWSRQLLMSFHNPFVYVLLVLAAISFCTDVYFAAPDDRDYVGITILLTMVTISALLRFVQEFRSLRAAEKLKAMVRTTATVQRAVTDTAEPARREVPMREVVAGDIVHLSAGDMIPADVRLLSSRDLFISQAVLTGEALPVEKYDTLGAVAGKSANTRAAGAANDASASLLDLENVCFMGTNVVSGTATAVVVATGEDTYFGSLARNVVSHKRVETSFDRGVSSVSWLLIRFMFVMVPVVFLINGLTKGDWLSALTFALAVAVGLTPEMLPMIVSANLARGAVAMARRKVVVKRLNSVQNFGAMDVLCTDKTGTLTQDRIILEHHLDLSGHRNEEILRLGWLNSFHQSGQKNLIDIAIVARADEIGERAKPHGYRKIDELPFDFVRRRLSVVVEDARGAHLLICKGAVEEMLAVSTHVQDQDGVHPLDFVARKRLLEQANAYNEDGFRVLVLATRTIARGDEREQYRTADERDLVVRGFLTFLDPPKESAAPALAALRENGVAVKVLTGDNPTVTLKVCRQVGLEPGKPMLGTDIEALDDATLARVVERTTVFAKLTPLQKARIVKALQANGHTVGFLGDGINDAPALRDADVGISVDSGADIAKETADIILLEKSLMVLEEGVIKGRETFGNILKYLNMTASSNFGNVFSVLVASAFLPWEPMLATQLLVLNLIYDTSQMLLPWDRMDPEFLKQPRKWEAGNIGRFMLWVGPTSSVFDITTYLLMWSVFGAGALYHLHGGSGGQVVMNSGWFIESLVSQTLVVHLLRTQKIPFLQSTASLPVLLSTFTAIAIGCWLPFSPFADALGFMHLPGSYWLWLAATMVGYILLAQIVKTIYVRRYRQWF